MLFRSSFLSFGLLASSQAAILVGDFQLNSDLSNSVGSSATLTPIGGAGTFGNGFYEIAPLQGLTLTSSQLAGAYSIGFSFEQDDTNSWRKLIDYSNLASDGGFYIDPSDQFRFFPIGQTGPNDFSGLTQLLATYDGSLLEVFVNQDPTPAFSVATPNANPFSSGQDSIFHLFQDDFATGQGEETTFRVRDIRLWDGVLTSDERRNAFIVSSVPEPSSALALGGLLLSSFFLRKRG